MRRLWLPAMVLTIASLVPSPAGPAAAGQSQRQPRGTRVETYADGLDFPVDMAWVPGRAKLFFTEKNTGRVRIIERGRLQDAPCVDLDVEADGERGALGLVLHPRFSKNHFLYVYYTNASPLEHRVTRFTVRKSRCVNAKHVVTGIDASSSGYHNGGQLEFLGGKLFVSTGEAHDPAQAQSTSNRLGKILRYNPNGTIPSDNPFGNAVWSYGHRNPFGLAANRASGLLYETENGPQCDDEVNLIRPGQNYGWGASYQCGSGRGDNPVEPLKSWTPPIVPTDLWWYEGRLESLSGSLYMGDMATGRLHRFVMTAQGEAIAEERIVLTDDAGIVDVTKGPGGWLYFATPAAIMRIVRA